MNQILAGRYQILEQLTQRGSAQVFLAQDLTLLRYVEVRKWDTGLGSAVIEVLTNLNDPRMIQIFDAVQTNDGYYMVTPEIRGKSVAEILQNKGEIQASTAAEIGLSLAWLAERMHKMGWVMRSISTEDIYVASFCPTPLITYLRIQRSDRDIDSIETIGQILMEIVSHMEETEEIEFERYHSLRLIAESATSAKYGARYLSFSAFIEDLTLYERKMTKRGSTSSKTGEEALILASDPKSFRSKKAGVALATTLAVFVVVLAGYWIQRGVQRPVQVVAPNVTDATAGVNLMPDYTGKNAAQLVLALVQKGISSDHIQLDPENSTESSGTVVSQVPLAGKPFDPQTTRIELHIAVPNGQSLVPNVYNMNIEAAGTLLIQRGLHYRYTVDQTNGVSGTVAQQELTPGQVVPAGTTVALHIRK